MKHLSVASFLIGSSLLAATAAQAQTAAGAGPAEAKADEIIVTGSRVIANGNNSPTPLTVLPVGQVLATRPTTVFEALLNAPEFAGSRGTTATNPGDSGPNNGNASALGLRGLGPVRTLVLLNGQRLPATQSNGFVDVNQVPQMLIERVDVVTGGASAVYGSDAISGVVNFVINRKFNGLKAQAQYGISTYGDEPSEQAGVAWGAPVLDGRGHVEFSYNYNHDGGIAHRVDRPAFAARWTAQGNGCPAGASVCVPYFLVANATISNMTFGGLITGPSNSTLNNQQFASNGTLSAFKAGTAIPGSVTQIGGDGAYNTVTSLKAALNLHQAFGRFDYELDDSTNFHVMGAATFSHTMAFEKDNRLQNISLSATNAFLPLAYQQAFAAQNITRFTFSKMFRGYDPNGGPVSLLPGKNADFWNKTAYVNGGFDGKFGALNWQVDYTFGTASQHSQENANINNGRLFAALDAVKDASGNIVCNVTLTNPGLYPGCVPINLFGPTSETQQMVDYIVQKTNTWSKSMMHDFSASLSGPVLDGWAGPITAALSGEWRKQSYYLTSDALPVTVSPQDCTGLRFNCTAPTSAVGTGTSQWNNNTYSNRPPVSQVVSEAAVEANIPLLRDLPLLQSASLTAAGRYAHYLSRGNAVITAPYTKKAFDAWTWKIGLDWHLNDMITLRATRSRDMRAPNLEELFGAASLVQNSGNQDLLVTNASNIVPFVQTGGNPNLGPETGNTLTIGAVFKPTSNLSLSVDYYSIRVDNFIQSAAGYTPAIQQACYNALRAGGNSFYCSLQERVAGLTSTTLNTPNNFVTKWYSGPLNIAQARTYGVDFELNYVTHIADHRFSLRALLALQPHMRFTPEGLPTLEGAGVLSNSSGVLGGGTGGGTGPVGAKTRLSVFAALELVHGLTLDWLARWRSGLSDLSDPSSFKDGTPASHANPRLVNDATLTYKFDLAGKTPVEAYLNVLNVFNTPPSTVAVPGSGAVDPGLFGGSVLGDDPTGRYFNMGVRVRF